MTPRTARVRGPHTHRLLALTLGIGLLASACSSDSKKVDTTTPGTVELVTPSTKATTSTSASSETSVAGSTDTTAAGDATTTTVPAGPTYPLTGLPLLDPAAANRPAMVVKIDNHPLARPQSGLNEADLVYEENVEDLTRFAAVFQSNGADPVGPIRSGRTQDVALLGSLNAPIFVWSGGNGRVTAAITASDLVAVSETKAGAAMFRDKRRQGPHDLYGNVSALYSFAPADAGPPQPQFQYRPAGTTPAGAPADGVKVSMDNAKVLWSWNPDTSTYLRFTDGKVHKDAINDDQLATSNVVILTVDYRPSPADGRSPEAQTLGTGSVLVFTAGTVVTGTWTRADRLAPFTLTAADGSPILLTPGHTFVELARTGKAAIVPTGTNPDKVPYP
jgi:hypothetical protein